MGKHGSPAMRVARRCVYEDRGYRTLCRIFTGSKNKGYGQISTGRIGDGTATMTTAHIVVWEDCFGPVPAGMQLDHLCRQPDCCEPTHLEVVTSLENKLRAAAVVTHCPVGHPYEGANLYRYKGHRVCKACRARKERERRARLRLARDYVHGRQGGLL